jgi:hypothetical protein
VIGPPLAGWLFDQHYGLPTVSMVLALGTLIAAGILAMLKLKPATEDTQDEAPAIPSVAGAPTSL